MSTILAKHFDELQKLLTQHSEALGRITSESTTLGEAREYFVSTVLARCLPKNIGVERGVVVNSESTGDAESNPQDVVLYRTDFPVLASIVGPQFLLTEAHS